MNNVYLADMAHAIAEASSMTLEEAREQLSQVLRLYENQEE